MKNQIVQQLNQLNEEEGKKLHILLDKVISIFEAQQSKTEGAPEVRFVEQTMTFETEINEAKVIVLRDFTAYAVIVRVVINNTIVAEAVVTTRGQFDERYSKMPVLATKILIQELFNQMSSLDTTEVVEAEVISEGDTATETHTA